jgi:hypothetical protein
MLQSVSKVSFAIFMGSLTIIFTACAAGLPTQEDILPMTPSGAQTVPEATPVDQSEPTVVGLPAEIPDPESSPINPPQPTAADLPTELVEPGSPVAPPTDEPRAAPAGQVDQPVPGSEAAVAAAIADMSRQTGIPADQISVESVTAMDWPDSAVGCPQEGMMYAQVITPGYLIVLATQGQKYEYHTDQQAANVVWCQK